MKKKVIGINDVTSEAENLCIFSNAEVEMIRSLVEKKQEKEKEKNG